MAAGSRHAVADHRRQLDPLATGAAAAGAMVLEPAHMRLERPAVGAAPTEPDHPGAPSALMSRRSSDERRPGAVEGRAAPTGADAGRAGDDAAKREARPRRDLLAPTASSAARGKPHRRRTSGLVGSGARLAALCATMQSAGRSRRRVGRARCRVGAAGAAQQGRPADREDQAAPVQACRVQAEEHAERKPGWPRLVRARSVASRRVCVRASRRVRTRVLCAHTVCVRAQVVCARVYVVSARACACAHACSACQRVCARAHARVCHACVRVCGVCKWAGAGRGVAGSVLAGWCWWVVPARPRLCMRAALRERVSAGLAARAPLVAAKAADPARPRGSDARPAELPAAASLQLPPIVPPPSHASPYKRPVARSGMADDGREGRRTPERLPLLASAHAHPSVSASDVAEQHEVAEVLALRPAGCGMGASMGRCLPGWLRLPAQVPMDEWMHTQELQIMRAEEELAVRTLRVQARRRHRHGSSVCKLSGSVLCRAHLPAGGGCELLSQLVASALLCRAKQVLKNVISTPAHDTGKIHKGSVVSKNAMHSRNADE